MVGCKGKDIVVVEVDKTQRDEEVGNKSELLDIVDVAVQTDRQEDDGLNQDPVFHVNVSAALCDGEHKGLQILGDKDDVGGGETDLTQDQGEVDEVSEVLAVDSATHVAKRGMHLETDIAQENEAPKAEGGNGKQNKVAEEHAAVEESPGQEEDTSSDKRLEQK